MAIEVPVEISAQQIKIDEERTTVTGDKGYCLVRATHAVKHGSYYFEVSVQTFQSSCFSVYGLDECFVFL